MWISWASARPSAKSCTWVRATPSINTEQPCREGLGGTGGWKFGHKPPLCAHRPEGQPYPGLHQKQHGRQVEGGDSSSPLWWDLIWSPPFSSGALSAGKTWSCWSGAREGHKNDPRAGASLLWGKAEKVGAVQPEEEKAAGDLIAAFQHLMGAYEKHGHRLFSWGCYDRTRGNVFKFKRVDSD